MFAGPRECASVDQNRCNCAERADTGSVNGVLVAQRLSTPVVNIHHYALTHFNTILRSTATIPSILSWPTTQGRAASVARFSYRVPNSQKMKMIIPTVRQRGMGTFGGFAARDPRIYDLKTGRKKRNTISRQCGNAGGLSFV